MITDTNGSIFEVNDSFTRMNGYTRQEVLGKKPRILKSGQQSSEFYKEMWDTLLETGNWRGEVSNRRKNGDGFITVMVDLEKKEDSVPILKRLSLV
ncbi:MAG: PAS domain S-box-containing protein [Glaciecola sp.]|jgi:PAS domain S-box-containing protein